MMPKFKVGDQVIADGDAAFITQIIDPPDSHPQDGFSYAVEWPTNEWGTFSEDEITEVTLMDNKLKKLAQQAGFGFRDGELYTAKLEHLPITQNMEKFAELIIQECITVVSETPLGYRDYRNQIEEGMLSACVDSLKEHFKINE